MKRQAKCKKRSSVTLAALASHIKMPDDNFSVIEDSEPHEKEKATPSGFNVDDKSHKWLSYPDLKFLEENSEKLSVTMELTGKEFTNPVLDMSGDELEASDYNERSVQELSAVVQNIPIIIQRTATNQQQLDKRYTNELPSLKQPFREQVLREMKKCCHCSGSCLLGLLLTVFPIFQWISQYSFRKYILNDILSGFIIFLLHIPEGLACGLLASVYPIHGLYVSFFPVMVYFLMGTSKHISIGSCAIISLMISNAINAIGAVDSEELSKHNVSFGLYQKNTSEGHEITPPLNSSWPPTKQEAFVVLCLTTGLWQVFLALIRFASFPILLSDQLMSGFTAGVAVLIAVSQIANIFDLHIKIHHGPFRIFYTLNDIFSVLDKVKPATLIISAIALCLLMLVKEQVNVRFQHRLRVPIPIDLILVILATVISYTGKFNTNLGVEILGEFPVGLPTPALPRKDLIGVLTNDGFTIAIVSFVLSLTVAEISAKKKKYPLDPHQEFLALGSANIFSCFFSCFPCSAGISRSLIQESTGGCTQIASLTSSVLMLGFLYAAIPLFYSLPKCILSCVILGALNDMFIQIKELKKIWNISQVDGLIWLVTFVCVVLLDAGPGIIAGAIFSLLTVIYRLSYPYHAVLGSVPETEIYLDKEHYTKLQDVSGIEIFYFGSVINYMNRHIFLSNFKEKTEKQTKRKSLVIDSFANSKVIQKSDEDLLSNKELHHIVIDCSSISYLDATGLNVLLEVMKEMEGKGIPVFLAGCSVPVYEMLKRSGFLTRMTMPIIFPTIHDAIIYALKPDVANTVM
ncbi:prestin-like isoform X2 [Tachypleus tridentatus]|uniref:prestin-like isoform X2 n=1 Tax=Tachypleus tridentatus TaxID=6853 RepID=UPI003FD026BF